MLTKPAEKETSMLHPELKLVQSKKKGGALEGIITFSPLVLLAYFV